MSASTPSFKSKIPTARSSFAGGSTIMSSKKTQALGSPSRRSSTLSLSSVPNESEMMVSTSTIGSGSGSCSSNINNHNHGEEEEGIQVAIRMRPLNDKEGNLKRVWKVLPKYASITQTTPDGQVKDKVMGRTFFSYDKTFPEKTTTRDVYDSIAKGIVSSVVSGLNGTIFAYGQTSSGKTFTMQGSGTIAEGSAQGGGIVHMAANDIFQHIQNATDRIFLVRVSFLEIYNEEVRDLLDTSGANTLPIREDPQRGVFVPSKEEIVTDMESLLQILFQGDKSRVFASTGMNERSSRSHTIFRVTIESREKRPEKADSNDDDDDDDDDESTADDKDAVLISTLNLVDLAGSESVRHTGATGDRLKEGAMINQSLMTLSRVIGALGSTGKTHINFRDSKLTRILQPSLSGNARMAIVCCATPSELYLEETRSTLAFAARAKLVKTNAKVNEVLDDRSLIRRLQKELAEARRNAEGGNDRQQMQALEQQAATAGTAAKAAEEKLKRLQSTLLNSGVLFSKKRESQSPRSRTERKRRRFSDSHRVFPLSPTAEVQTKARIPQTLTPGRKKPKRPRRKISAPPGDESEMFRMALSTKTDIVKTLEERYDEVCQLLQQRDNEIVALNQRKSELTNQRDSALQKSSNLEELVGKISSDRDSLKAELETEKSRGQEAKKSILELQRKAIVSAELYSELENKFESLKEENLKCAFELGQLRSDKEKFTAEQRQDRQQLQDASTNASRLQSTVNGLTEQLASARAEHTATAEKMQLTQAALENEATLRLQLGTKVSELETSLKEHKSTNLNLQTSVESLESTEKEIRSQLDTCKATLLTRDGEVEALEEERDEMEMAINHLNITKDEMQERNDSMSQELAKLGGECNALKSKVGDLEVNLSQAQEQNDLFSDEVKDLKDKLTKTSSDNVDLQDQLESANNASASKDTEISNLSEELHQATDEHKSLQERLVQEETEKDAMSREGETLRAELSVLQEKLKDYNERLNTAASETKQLETQYNALEHQLQESNAVNSNLATKRDELENHVELLTEAIADAQRASTAIEIEKETLTSELESTKANVQSYKDQVEGLRQQSGDLERVRDDMAETIRKLQDLLTQSNSTTDELEKKLSALQVDLEGAQSSIGTMEQENSQLVSSRQQLTQRCEELEISLRSKTTELESANSMNGELTSTIETVRVESEKCRLALDNAKSEYTNLENRLSVDKANLELMIAEAREQIKTIGSEKASLSDSLQETREALKAIELENNNLSRENRSLVAARDKSMEEVANQRQQIEEQSSGLTQMEDKFKETKLQRDELLQQQESLSSQLSHARSELKVTSEKVAQLEQETSQKTATLETMAADLQCQEVANAELQEKNESLKKQVDELKVTAAEKVAQLEQEISQKTATLETMAADLQCQEVANAELQEKNESLKKQVDELKVTAAEKVAQLEQEISQKRATLETMAADLQCQEVANAELQEKNESLKKQVDELKVTAAEKVAQLEQEISQKTATLETMAADLQCQEVANAELQEKNESLKKQVDELKVTAAEKVAQLEQEISQKTATLETMAADLQCQEVANAELQEKHESLKKQAYQMDELQRKLEASNDALRTMECERDATRNDLQEQLVKQNETLDSVQKELTDANKKCLDLSDDVRQKAAALKEAQTTITNVTSKFEEIEASTVAKEDADRQAAGHARELSDCLGQLAAAREENLLLESARDELEIQLESTKQKIATTETELDRQKEISQKSDSELEALRISTDKESLAWADERATQTKAIDQLRAEVSSKVHDIEKLQDRLNAAKDDERESKTKLEDATEQLRLVSEEYGTLKAHVQSVQSKLESSAIDLSACREKEETLSLELINTQDELKRSTTSLEELKNVVAEGREKEQQLTNELESALGDLLKLEEEKAHLEKNQRHTLSELEEAVEKLERESRAKTKFENEATSLRSEHKKLAKSADDAIEAKKSAESVKSGLAVELAQCTEKHARVLEENGQLRTELKEIRADRTKLTQEIDDNALLYQRQFDTVKSEYTVEVARAQGLLDQSQARATSAEKQTLALQKELERISDELQKSINDVKDGKDELLNTHDLLETTRSNYERTKQMLADKEVSFKMAETEMISTIDSLQKEKSELEIKLRDVAVASPDNAQGDLASLQSQCVNLKTLLESSQQENAALDHQMDEQRRELLKELAERENDLRKSESEAYKAREMLSEVQDERDSNFEKAAGLESKVRALEKENSRMDRTKRRLEKEKDAEIQNLKHNLRQFQSRVDESSRRSAHAEEQRRNTEVELEWAKKELRSRNQEIESMGDASQLRKDNERQRRMIDDLSRKISKRESESDTLASQTPAQIQALEAKVESLSREINLKDERIQKLEKTKLTKDKIKKWRETKMENGKYKERCEKQEKKLAEYASILSTMSNAAELKQQLNHAQERIQQLEASKPPPSTVDQTELANTLFTNQALETKLKKYAIHCQNLEEEKLGIKEALRVSKMLDPKSDDVSGAVMAMTDRMASLEQQIASDESERLHQENMDLREKVKSTESAAISLQQQNAELSVQMQELGQEKTRKIHYLEGENLKLLKDLKATKRSMQELRSEMQELRSKREEDRLQSSFLNTSGASRAPLGFPNQNQSSTTSRKTKRTVMGTSSQKKAARSDRGAGDELSPFDREIAQLTKADQSDRNIRNESYSFDKENGANNLSLTEPRAFTSHGKPKRPRAQRAPGLGESFGPANEENSQECQQS